jgi:hypothetical protein
MRGRDEDRGGSCQDWFHLPVPAPHSIHFSSLLFCSLTLFLSSHLLSSHLISSPHFIPFLSSPLFLSFHLLSSFPFISHLRINRRDSLPCIPRSLAHGWGAGLVQTPSAVRFSRINSITHSLCLKQPWGSF